jgi:hypothetical protein
VAGNISAYSDAWINTTVNAKINDNRTALRTDINNNYTNVIAQANGNYSLIPKLASNNIYTDNQNFTTKNLTWSNNVGISTNSSGCIILKGETSELAIC